MRQRGTGELVGAEKSGDLDYCMGVSRSEKKRQ